MYEQFVRQFPTPDALGQSSIEDVNAAIYSLGLRWRAPLLLQLGQELAKREGIVPTTLEELKSLPGVGPYAAAAWLSFHGQKRMTIVDANVVRFIGRLLDQPIDGETRREKWLLEAANSLTPRQNWKEYNYAVLDFTMLICTKSPECIQCPVGSSLCAFGKRLLQENHE